MLLATAGSPEGSNTAALSSLLSHRHEVGHCTVLTLVGEIDCVTAPSLRKVMAALLDECDGTVIVDVALVTSMDGAGLYTLLMGSRRTSWAPGSIRLVVPSGALRRKLVGAQADSVLPIYDTIEAAVAVRSKPLPRLLG
jgi:anti-anti-sigma factor